MIKIPDYRELEQEGFCLIDLALSDVPSPLTAPRYDAHWLGLVLHGDTSVECGDQVLALHAGDLFHAPASHGIAARALRKARVLLVQLPGASPLFEAIPAHGHAERIDHESAPAMLLAALLRTASTCIDTLSAHDHRPLELALVTFFNACLAAKRPDAAARSMSTYRKTLLQRACAIAEQRLRDNSASAFSLARDLAVSTRYLQRLFAATGEQLSLYLRRRRLEGAYQALMDPRLAGESVAQIAYRCGFNDAAYFSRAFRTHFGMPPSRHRQARGLSFAKAIHGVAQ